MNQRHALRTPCSTPCPGVWTQRPFVPLTVTTTSARGSAGSTEPLSTCVPVEDVWGPSLRATLTHFPPRERLS